MRRKCRVRTQKKNYAAKRSVAVGSACCYYMFTVRKAANVVRRRAAAASVFVVDCRCCDCAECRAVAADPVEVLSLPTVLE